MNISKWRQLYASFSLHEFARFKMKCIWLLLFQLLKDARFVEPRAGIKWMINMCPFLTSYILSFYRVIISTHNSSLPYFNTLVIGYCDYHLVTNSGYCDYFHNSWFQMSCLSCLLCLLPSWQLLLLTIFWPFPEVVTISDNQCISTWVKWPDKLPRRHFCPVLVHTMEAWQPGWEEILMSCNLGNFR